MIDLKRDHAIMKINWMVDAVKKVGDFVDYDKLVRQVMLWENINERKAKEYIKVAGILSPTEIKKRAEELEKANPTQGKLNNLIKQVDKGGIPL